MAKYQDTQVNPGTAPADIYAQITTLLIGAYSVEVIPDGSTVILRVWFSQGSPPGLNTREFRDPLG